MAMYEAANYRNAARFGRLTMPTMKFGPVPLVRLDHVLYDGDSNYLASSRTRFYGGSDHLPVTATVTAKNDHIKTLYY